MDRNYPGPCSDCCDCNGPLVALAYRSASKSKCGYVDSAHPTTPPTKYLKEVVTTSFSDSCSDSGTSRAFNTGGTFQPAPPNGANVSFTAGCSVSWTMTKTFTIDPSMGCATTCTASGSLTSSTSSTNDVIPDAPGNGFTASSSSDSTSTTSSLTGGCDLAYTGTFSHTYDTGGGSGSTDCKVLGC